MAEFFTGFFDAGLALLILGIMLWVALDKVLHFIGLGILVFFFGKLFGF
jgi:hypothetical protein